MARLTKTRNGKTQWTGPSVRFNDAALRVAAAAMNVPWYEVAARAGIARTSLSLMRHERRPMSAEVVARLEKALDLPAGALLLPDDSSDGK